MATYKTPGTYIDEVSKFPAGITDAPTSVTVFAGYTQLTTDKKGNSVVLQPQQITSLHNYTTIFGNQPGNGYLYESVVLFYENGGGDCYVISTGNNTDAVSFTALDAALNVCRELPVQLLAIPDACLLPATDFYRLQNNMLAQCDTLKNRFAILNTLTATNTIQDVADFRAGIDSTNGIWGAVYYPWLVLSNNKAVPPCGAVAGIYVQTDNSRGVWKAPANVIVNAVTALTQQIDNALQENMNVDVVAGKSVNAIRTFTGRGIMVWGARTLQGNNLDWRYVNVRRFITTVEQSIITGTAGIVFEPNNANTWAAVKASIENYLIKQWNNGALADATPEHAFFVQAGLGQTMTQQDITEGRLIILIGLAVARPAEFIIIKIEHKMIAA